MGSTAAQRSTAGGADYLRVVWILGKKRITNSKYTSQSANHADPTARSPTAKRIRLGPRNSRV